MIINPKKECWQGRTDGLDDDLLRWHQIVVCQPVGSLPVAGTPGSVGLVGFACDEGVRRNMGRTGARMAPDILRAVCANLPAHSLVKGSLTDVGNCECENTALEQTQQELADTVTCLVQKGYRPMVLGGGHEVVYGHFKGLRNALPGHRIGIINFDAHFDLREPSPGIGASSGTGFWQIAQETPDFHYLALGIQPNSNTRRLFTTARLYDVTYITGEDFYAENRAAILDTIRAFIARVDKVYLTICMDVFAAPYAPGVSAVAYNGIVPDRTFRDALRTITTSSKLAGADIAELNPASDIDHRTARLAAGLVFDIVNAWV